MRLTEDEKLFYIQNYERTHKENKNELIVVVGDTGGGKSYTALRLAEIITRGEFDLKNLSFLPSGFLRKIQSAGKGEVIILDDSGIALNARDFMSRSNKILSIAIESCRFKNQTLILTVPNLKMIDINARRLMHTCFWMRYIVPSDGWACASWYNVQKNAISGDVYFTHPKIQYDGETKEKETIRVLKASDALLEEYEREKRDFLDPLYVDLVSELEGIES